MQQTTLLTPNEVQKFAGLPATFPLCNLSDLLQTEQWEFRNCLGNDLYEWMLGAVADYSNAPVWATGTYNAGNVVAYRGTYWKAKITNNTEPIIENQFWAIAPKFDDGTECGQLYNELYCNYLARYISLKIALLSITTIAVVATGNGVVRYTGNDMIPADKQEIDFLMRAKTLQASQTLENMQQWMKTKKSTKCFPEYDQCGKPIEPCVCEEETGCTLIKRTLFSAT